MRDEVKKNDPSLVEFSKLSEHERNQNLHVAHETLRSAPYLDHRDILSSPECFDAFIHLDTQMIVLKGPSFLKL